ncbi:hypothetical protein [Arthrobacter sp. YAF34]|uniref:hypothetical protein n=1 Tax=Arthrobacter sp. YAF34 TaxID=3233083 RepID=UPI003F93EF6C
MDLSEIVETVAIVCGPSSATIDLQLIPADVVLVRTAEDLAAKAVAESDAYLVVPGGLDLMSSLLRKGRISNSAQILWSFGLPVRDSLTFLGTLELPVGMVVTGFGGSANQSILRTAVQGDDVNYDVDSFRMGLEAARLDEIRAEAQLAAEEQAAERRLLHDLTARHLNLLAALGTTGQFPPDSGPAGGTHSDVAELQDQLARLKRNYAVLERKYSALAQSKLGRITLKIWDRKRLTAPAARNPTRSKS